MSVPTIEELSSVPILGSLKRTQLQAAARLFTVRSYPRNAIVATEGDRVDHFNFVLSGEVQAFWRDEAGHQLKLGVDGPGAHFPDVALGGEPALVSHIAVTDLRLASIRMVDMGELLRRHPQMAHGLLMDVVARLRRMLTRTRTLTMQDVYGRVVKALLAASVSEGGKFVTEPLTHAEIGHRVDATREMVGRVLRDLARGGYIKTGRGRITLLRKLPSRW